jgi:hypothetical protein
VVLLALRREVASASALAREHLAEYPDDAVIERLVARWDGQ